ncbi:GNAT family N-acetyltransferase [Halorussus halophilus]|uniref:GNAT family N-acetyltransferase n=1 Tax=Halorussus halophilus TaxID=2650975 RepID=UPI00130117CB|nr:GNAT family protein [Halorussus halophilus]
MSDLFPEHIETDRLVLEPLTTENVDVLAYYRLCSHQNPHIEEITEFLSWEPHETPKETLEFVESREDAWHAGEDATYVVRPKGGEDGAGEIAGAAGLHPHWGRRTATLGTWLRKPFWGRGYSGERALALIEVAFERLDLEVVTVNHQTGNENSRRAIEKYVEQAGGQHEGLLRNGTMGPDGPVDCHRYSVTREQWEESRDE